MDYQYLLLNPQGRIGQRDFWIGAAIVLGGNFIASFIPLLGTVVSIALIYVGVCVYGKRLHDAGRSAWIHLLPWIVSFILWAVALMTVGGAILSMALEGDVSFGGLMAAGGSFFIFSMITTLIWLIYTIWVGSLRGDEGSNAYGPPPVINIEANSVD